MSWRRFAAARQFLVEERFGSALREQEQAESDEFARAKRLAPRG